MKRTDRIPERGTWDRYWKNDKPLYPPHPQIIERVGRYAKAGDAVIVEIGSGLGVDTLEIAKDGFFIVSLDISREALKLQTARAADRGLDIPAVVADALFLPFKECSIDFLYHQGLAEHFSDPGSLLSEQRRVLKSGGILLVDVPQALTLYTLKKKWAIFRGKWFAGWETQYTPRKLEHLVRSSGFRIHEIYGRDYDLPPLVWMRDIETLGKTRFKRPIVPRPVRNFVGGLWRRWEKGLASKYLNLCIGIVAGKDENRD